MLVIGSLVNWVFTTNAIWYFCCNVATTTNTVVPQSWSIAIGNIKYITIRPTSIDSPGRSGEIAAMAALTSEMVDNAQVGGHPAPGPVLLRRQLFYIYIQEHLQNNEIPIDKTNFDNLSGRIFGWRVITC